MDQRLFPQHQSLLRQTQWARLTMNQLQKDAALCGIDWPEIELPATFEDWVNFIYDRLLLMDKQNPEHLARFLYRVDLPEKTFLQNPFPSESMAESVLKREFMKVWFKAQYKP